jgi:prophage antirepressor-like protein
LLTRSTGHGRDIRMITKDDERWFAGADLGHAMGFPNGSCVFTKVSADDKTLIETQTHVGPRKVSYIKESAIRSRLSRGLKPAVKDMWNWFNETFPLAMGEKEEPVVILNGDGVEVFNFKDRHPVRAVQQDGQPWFLGMDVCKVLELDNRKTRRKLDDDDDEVGLTHITDSIGREQEVIVVNEPGLYNLILRSRKPEAKAFRRWVTHEVLPQIRKTGGYIPVKKDDSEQVILAKALKIMNATLEQKDELIAVLQPKTPVHGRCALSKGGRI